MKTRIVDLRNFLLLFTVIVVAFSCTNNTKEPAKNTSDAESNDRLDWFHEAKFGLFIHWGLYAVPAGEWNGKTGYGEWIQYNSNIPGAEYEKLTGKFNPTDFNAREWVSLAKQFGMKYMVITTKHHEGFCMYDSDLTDYDIVEATPYGKDPMKDLAEECAKQGVKLCFYYSVKDWHHTNYPVEYTYFSKNQPNGFVGRPDRNEPDYKKYFSYLQGQVKELLTNYGPVGIIWFDWYGSAFDPEEEENREMARQLVDSIHKWQPTCLINNRLGGFGADYGTPEQEIPGGASETAFEVCMTLNNHWGYNKNDNNWKSTKEVIYNLCDITSKGGNYLLNIGPTAEGVFPNESIEILEPVGNWLEVNGDAIYNAAGGGPSVRWNPDIDMITTKPGKYFLHIFDYPEDNKVYLNDFENQVRNVFMLADRSKTPLKFKVFPHGVMIYLPEKPIDEINNIVAVEYSSN